jgi:hypothetical protein
MSLKMKSMTGVELDEIHVHQIREISDGGWDRSRNVIPVYHSAIKSGFDEGKVQTNM